MRIIVAGFVVALAGCSHEPDLIDIANAGIKDAQANYDRDYSPKALKAAQDRDISAAQKYAAEQRAKWDRDHPNQVAFAKTFCAKMPIERDAYAAELWDRESTTPGSRFTSYRSVRFRLYRNTGC
jgi:hypothetical protein